MQSLKAGRGVARSTAGLLTLILLAGCQTLGETESAIPATPSPKPAEAIIPGCEEFLQYVVSPQATVTVLAGMPPDERELLAQAWSTFESCTGIRIVFETIPDFEDGVSTRLADSTLPDLAIVPNPRIIEQLAQSGRLIPAPPQVVANVRQFWQPTWADYGSVEQTLFGAPLGAQVASLVWYSPRQFAAWGVQIPGSWDAMLDLSDRLADTGSKPWCAGIAAVPVSGLPAAGWLSELILRLYGGVVYDRWVTNELEFLTPQVIGAMQVLEYWLRNPDYVNGGFGDAESIATTPVEVVGQSVVDGTCAMLQQDSRGATAWQLLSPDVEISPDGDLFAFLLPGMDDAVPQPVIGSGDFVIGFVESDATNHVRSYLTSANFAVARAALGNWVTAHSQVPADVYPSPIDQLTAGILTQPETVFRVTGAELMPPSVGLGAFPEQMRNWFAGSQSTEDALGAIDTAWGDS